MKVWDQIGASLVAIFFATIKRAALALFLLNPISALAQDNQLGRENYIEADVNNDGILTYTEFVTFIDLSAADDLGRAKLVSSRGLHERAFRRVDTNRDGLVTPQELQASSQ